MRRIFTLAFALSAVTCSYQNLFAQCVPLAVTNCTAPTETFEDRTTITGSGFTSTNFTLQSINGNNADKFLESSNFGAGPTKTLLSPTFVAPAVGQTLSLRFDLGGSGAKITALEIIAKTTSGDIVLCTGATTTLSGVSCFNFVVPSTLAGKSFQFSFKFTISGTNNDKLRFDDFGTNAPNQGSLPVKFTGLNAKKLAAGTQITWNVADEINVNRYEVEKATTANQYTKIGSVNASGKSSYSFTDASNSPVSFYRIKSVDEDGKFAYSTILSLNNGKSVMVFKAFPSPVQSMLTVQHQTALANGKITISTQDGRLVKSIAPGAGSIETKVDMSTLGKGMYLLKFDAGNGAIEIMKVLKN